MVLRQGMSPKTGISVVTSLLSARDTVAGAAASKVVVVNVGLASNAKLDVTNGLASYTSPAVDVVVVRTG
jgi:hypothetical protein